VKEIERKLTPQKYKQLFGQLSKRQMEIISDKESRCIVVAAGPGSGKTRVLVHKLASLLLLEDVKHEQLLMLTFSRASATEFKQRLIELIGNAAHFVEIKTFHSYCFDLLGRIGNLEDVKKCVSAATEMIENGEVEPNRIGKSVLVIDEAQSLPNDTLEALRLLGNLETERQKMLHIVLFGQPELDEKLSMNIFRQLRQRITFSCYLSPLDFEQTYAYLNYRMRAAGYKGAELFGRRQAKKIYKYTKGIPRLINVVASKCLMLAYAQSLYKITNEHIKDSILDTKQNVVNVSNSVDKLTVFLIILIIIMLAAACILLIWE
jgi:type II secretory pathway predicted ATPase ExeA